MTLPRSPGDLTKEEDVLDWLVQNKSTGDDDDEIEDVSETMLEAMIDSVDYLAVLFCEFCMATIHYSICYPNPESSSRKS